MERGREKRLPDGTPQRSGGSIDPECRRPPARNALFYSFATQSLSSLFSHFYPLLPPPQFTSFSSCLALSLFCLLFSSFRLSSRLLCSLFTLLFFKSYRFSRYPDSLYFTFISINLSLFLTFIDFNLLFFF